MKWSHIAIYSFVGVIATFLLFTVSVFNIFDFMEYQKKVKIHGDASCFLKKGIIGAEDQTDWSHHCIFSSSSDRLNLL